MTSTSTHLASMALFSAFALSGCPGSTTNDAGVDAGFCVGCCAASCADTFNADAPAQGDAAPDAPTEADAFSPTDAFSAEDARRAYNAIVSTSCGPADGPAIQIEISNAIDRSTCTPDPMAAVTSFYIHDLGGATLPPAPGATITSVEGAINGNASVCPGGTPPCRSSELFSITFATFSVAGGASGQYTIQWPDGSATSGTFDADRCMSRPPVCG